MRIAHIITRLILGGAQENTLFNCEDLAQLYGDDVLLITGPALGPEGSLLDRAQQGRGGLKLEIIDSMRRAVDPWRDAVAYQQLKRALRKFRPDVVHTHSAKAGILGRAAAHALGVPAIIHGVHGAPFHDYQSRLAWRFSRDCERWAARRCHAMISVADAMTDLMVSAGVAPRSMFTTVYSGMEVEPFLAAPAERDRVRRELGYADGDVVIGKIARLFHLKGHEYVLRAAQSVVAANPHAKFLFVGDGILQAELKRQIAALGLERHFQFTGLVPPERIPELIAAMDIVVHTSLREGLARVLPQALIVGRPVASYDIDGAREVAIPGQTGYLLPPESVTELAQALIGLAADPARRAQYGQEGRRRFTDQFRHEHMTSEIRKVYERVLSELRN
jgi:glycosyltransferase involved in cell wall biosynthesis